MRQRVGLALSGGVVRGMAHLGVLSVLHNAGIPIDVVAGTSAGSLIGVMVAAGFTPTEIHTHSTQMNWRRVARPVWPRDGFVCFNPMEHYLADVIGDITFADLKLPFAVVTADMEEGTEVVLCEGRVVPAVRASCSVPGFVTPRAHQDRLLGDGSIINNLPSSVARQLGADFVIGVDIFEPEYKRRHLGPLKFGLAAIETMVDRAGGGQDDVDCLIRPALRGMSYVRFNQREALFQRGAQAAMQVLPGLKRALGMPV